MLGDKQHIKEVKNLISHKEIPEGFNADHVEFCLVEGSEVWLPVAYELLTREFNPSTLDPYERYDQWLDMNREGTHPFPFLMVVAYIPQNRRAMVVGVASGNIMEIIDHESRKSVSAPPSFVFALGHQVTCKPIREAGIKGVGSRLTGALTDIARQWIKDRNGDFLYSVLEAEQDSAGFWSKVGYRWPKGTRYWQPPLQFNSDGQCVWPEVPEILMLKPIDGKDPEAVEQTLLKDIIATLYLNWSLFKYRNELSPSAMQRAEHFVMVELFGRIVNKMPQDKHLKLVSIELTKADGSPKHFRSIALSTGIQHGFKSLKSPKLDQVRSFSDMLEVMKDMAFGARTLGQAADVLYAMATDRQCKVVLTLAGAVSIAKLDLILAEMIERGLVHCIVSTGAILCHGFNAERGGYHFKVPQDVSDEWLFEHGYNRIYDTIETEYILDELQEIFHEILANYPPDQILCSSELIHRMGQYLVEAGIRGGLIQAAYQHNVPIFVPAFTDSEIGLDFALYNYYQKQKGKEPKRFDPFLDFERYCEFIANTDTRGILTLGGGVPRNWAQQIGPFLDAIERHEHAVAVNSARFKYALRICPDPPFWGGLSGCTYSEGVSWGKFVPVHEGGQFAEVLSDFTLVFPLLAKGLFQRLDKQG